MATKGKRFGVIFLVFSFLLTTIFLSTPLIAAESPGANVSPADVSLHIGAATLSIPLEVPPGRNGIQPNIALTYNSYQGDGWIGVGWELDVGAIQRSTKFGVDYSARDFVVVRNGASTELRERLDWGQNYFGAKIEEAFNKYYLNTSTGGWKVTAKDGTKYFYGSTVSSRQDNNLGIFKWCLDRVEDTNGNFMRISYKKDQGQIYLELIEYTGHESLNPTNAVRFYPDKSRPDIPQMYAINSKVLTAYLLDKVEVTSADGLVRRYQLKYSASAKTKRSLLTEIQQGPPMPPVTFNYIEEPSGFKNYSKRGAKRW